METSILLAQVEKAQDVLTLGVGMAQELLQQTSSGFSGCLRCRGVSCGAAEQCTLRP